MQPVDNMGNLVEVVILANLAILDRTSTELELISVDLQCFDSVGES
jgi:hypothetical protein